MAQASAAQAGLGSAAPCAYGVASSMLDPAAKGGAPDVEVLLLHSASGFNQLGASLERMLRHRSEPPARGQLRTGYDVLPSVQSLRTRFHYADLEMPSRPSSPLLHPLPPPQTPLLTHAT